MLDINPGGQVFTALDGTLLYANPTFLRLVQADQTLPLNEHSFQDFLSRGGAIFYETQFAPALLLRGHLSEISMDLVSKDRRRIPVLVNAAVSRDADNQPVGISIAIFEGVQRKDYENELLRSRRELEQIAEVVRRSADGIISLTPDGSIQSWNNGAQQIFGSPHPRRLEHHFSFFGEEEQSDLHEAIRELEDGAEVNRDITGLKKTGATVELSICLTLVQYLRG